ncbi:probable cytochrome P450 6a14 [Sergentomyia squamirostris]
MQVKIAIANLLLNYKFTPSANTKYPIEIVTETVDYREKENVHRDDFLNLLIQLKNKGKLDGAEEKEVGKITSNELIANAYLFLMAGFETSSTTMKFCLLELAQYPEIQNRVREEIKSILLNNDNKITYESLSQMKYLEQVINETLRKHPVAGGCWLKIDKI